MRELFASGEMLCLLLTIFLGGCRTRDTYPYESDAGIDAIVYQLQTQYGVGGKYSAIQMNYEDSTGLVLTSTGVVEGSAELVVRQMKKGKWQQLSAVSLKNMVEAPVFFTLDSVSYLKKIPKLIRNSAYKLTAEMRKSGLHAKEVLINTPDAAPDGDPIRIHIHIHPDDELGKFEYSYNLAGVLKGVQQY